MSQAGEETVAAPAVTVEANFDGLASLVRNHSKLALGAAIAAQQVEPLANPKAAALQGLAKMRTLAKLGVAQGVLPPQDSLHIPTLKALGFDGRDAEVLYRVRRDAPQLLAAMASASPLWTANAATVSAGADCADGRVHFTAANLESHAHRGAEPAVTQRALATIFRSEKHFLHHPPLRRGAQMSDEGSANHLRLCADFDRQGLNLYAWGIAAVADDDAALAAAKPPAPPVIAPVIEPARQHHLAGVAISRWHRLDPGYVHHAQQHPDAIDAGAAQAGMLMLGHRELLIHHEKAFVDGRAIRSWLQRRMSGREPVVIEIRERDLGLDAALETALFGSQIVSLADGSMRLLCTQPCRDDPRAWAVIRRLIDDPRVAIGEAVAVDLGELLRDGGGPASTGLRVVLDPAQQAAVNPKVWLDDTLATRLEAWIGRHYRDRLRLDDLADPQLLDSQRLALDELTQILGLGSLYDFQR